MHTWILFMWLASFNNVPNPDDNSQQISIESPRSSISTQEFSSHESCLNAAIKLKDTVGDDLRFFCIDKSGTDYIPKRTIKHSSLKGTKVSKKAK